MAYNGAVFVGTLIDINIAAAGALAVLSPVLAQIDFTVFGSLGLGALQGNLQAQLSAALQAALQISTGIANPFAGFAAALAGIGVLQATITLALSGTIPAISLDVLAQLSALASFSATLGVQVGGLEALIQGAISVKGPAISFGGSLAAALAIGPVFVISWENIPMFTAGADINTDFSTGLSQGGFSILPGESVYGVLLVTKTPGAWSAIQATLRT